MTLLNLAASRPRQAVCAVVALFALTVTTPVHATITGPDSFGYTASNSASPYDFADISATGTNQNLGIGTSASVNFGFTFNFYGTNYTSTFINSNGYFHFAAAANDLDNKDLLANATPIAGLDIPGIFLYWDDWDPTGANNVYTQTLGAVGSRRFIAQWQNVSNFNTGQSGTYEVVLFEGSNNILFQYKSVAGPGNALGGTIGIGNTGAPANGRVLQWSHNTASISDSSTILITRLVPEPSAIALVLVGGMGLVPRRFRRA